MVVREKTTRQASKGLAGAVSESAAGAAVPPAPGRRATRSWKPHGTLLDVTLRYAMLIVLVVLVIAARISYSHFFEPVNLRDLLTQNASVGIVAVGMTLVLISGGFDLSVGSVFAIGSTLFALFTVHGVPIAVAGVLTVVIGCGFGLVNGILVTWLGVNAFVATLGSGAVIAGIAYQVSHNNPVFVSNPNFGVLNSVGPLQLQWSVWLMIVLLVLGGLVLSRTTYGRGIYAVGGNEEAAYFAGLRVSLLRVSTYVVVGGCAALGGMILASTLSVGEATQGGSSVTLDTISAVVVGGTSLYGGEGAMWRTAVGVLILGTLDNFLGSLALGTSTQSIVQGLVIIGAVALDALSRRRARR